MRTFVDGGNPGVVGLVAIALAGLGVLTFGWGSYLGLAGAAALALLAARASQDERLPFPREDDWRIDERTRDAARRGLNGARAALDRCRRGLQAAHKPRGGQR
jgi:hypothetical protein